MSLACGIVGLPNVGKSTLFNALTASGIAAENYPFCTIEPNQGIVEVPDQRLQKIAEIARPEKTLPNTVTFVDIAGLVEGASKGEGLGNQFLAHIRETQAIVHVVRCFDDGNVVHVSGSVDPVRDADIINTELLLADFSSVEKQLQKSERLAKSGNKDEAAKRDVLAKVLAALDQGTPARALSFSEDELALMEEFHLITAKPVLYVANISDDAEACATYVSTLAEHAASEQAQFVVVCAQTEAEIAELDNASERTEFLEAMGLTEPGLNRVIRAGFELLHLQTFFTAGPKEVRAWTTHIGASAPQAAGEIHTDFEKGFIRAEVIGLSDYLAHQGEQGAKEAGKLRVEGKTYVVQDGDIMHFRFNV